MRKRRLALFIPSLAGGGAEAVFLNLAQGFSSRGYDTDLLVVDKRGPLISSLPRDVNLVDLAAKRASTSLLPLASYLRQSQPAALLSGLGHCNLVAILANWLTGGITRTFVSEHNNLSSTLQHRPSLKLKSLRSLNSILYPTAQGIVAVSSGVADDLARSLSIERCRIHVVHNPVVTQSMLQKSNEGVDHHWFSSGSIPVLLAAGRLEPQKDFPTLVKAFGKVCRSRPARLLILGDGSQRNNIASLIRSLGLERFVELMGFVENPYPYMRRADLFVLSSAWEGFGNVLVEAMACGTQVIATNCPSGPSEILADGAYGRLVPVGDYDALAAAILDALGDGDKPDVIGRASKFNIDSALDAYETLMFG